MIYISHLSRIMMLKLGLTVMVKVISFLKGLTKGPLEIGEGIFFSILWIIATGFRI